MKSLNDLHQNEELTSKDARNYVTYAEYRLEWFDRIQNTFGQRKIAREDWEKSVDPNKNLRNVQTAC